ncbi:hypothetical protein [Thermodesulfovibrio yellowstonii]|uniref:hypothetical protein n=1 Tax=Thermodesulfovibrio yellowstonii TaxID=28262 RepID=UPI0024B38685|nr:hypothetical protein [Thermodesulfovibrio yellowstonii]MDI6864658.1 hypothetical protein [Thermodesulfovibrio yellowstonii]
MNTRTLNMIFKLKEWEEELEKQKFAKIMSDRRKIEMYMRELEERFSSGLSSCSFLTSEELTSIYNEIQYLIAQLMETEKILQKIDEELEKQRQAYEEAFKEKKKIEQLNDKLIGKIKNEREKLEEKIAADIFTSRIRSG